MLTSFAHSCAMTGTGEVCHGNNYLSNTPSRAQQFGGLPNAAHTLTLPILERIAPNHRAHKYLRPYVCSR